MKKSAGSTRGGPLHLGNLIKEGASSFTPKGMAICFVRVWPYAEPTAGRTTKRSAGVEGRPATRGIRTTTATATPAPGRGEGPTPLAITTAGKAEILRLLCFLCRSQPTKTIGYPGDCRWAIRSLRHAALFMLGPTTRLQLEGPWLHSDLGRRYNMLSLAFSSRPRPGRLGIPPAYRRRVPSCCQKDHRASGPPDCETACYRCLEVLSEPAIPRVYFVAAGHGDPATACSFRAEGAHTRDRGHRRPPSLARSLRPPDLRDFEMGPIRPFRSGQRVSRSAADWSPDR